MACPTTDVTAPRYSFHRYLVSGAPSPQLSAPRVVKLSQQATSVSWPKSDTYYSSVATTQAGSVTAEEPGDALSRRTERGAVRWA